MQGHTHRGDRRERPKPHAQTAARRTVIDTSGFTDLDVVCRACGEVFTVTAAEGLWFHDRGLATPRRCRPCRQAQRHAGPRA